MKKILLVEDSEEIYQMVLMSVQSIAEITWAPNLTEARALSSHKDFHLLLLDRELPDGNGLTFCAEILQNNPLLPIFFITAQNSLSDKVLGLSAGADDYITKPFDPLELRARIESRLKKNELLMFNSDRLQWPTLQIQKSSQEVKVLKEQQWVIVELTALEFKILMYFVHRLNQVVSREIMLNDIWGVNTHVYSRSVDTHVSKLRRKLGDASDVIESVHGVGYKFNPFMPS